MSLVLEKALENAAEKILRDYSGISYNDKVSPSKVEKRRTRKMSWMDFSDEELRIVNEIEKHPGMKQTQIIAMMSVDGSGPDDATCEAGTTRILLANLVKRRVLISSATGGYILNDSDTPPPSLPSS